MTDVVVIDRKTAENEFERLCKSWHIETENQESDNIETIIKAIHKGTLRVKDGKDGCKLLLDHHLVEPLSDSIAFLTYRFVTAGDMMVMDRFKSDQTFKMMTALVNAISTVDINLLYRMANKDLLLGQMVGGLFLAV